MLTIPRPSHSDYPAFVKYNGNNDIRGGGHFSGRLTAPIVFAGSIAKQILKEKGINVGAHIKRIGEVNDEFFDMNNINDNILEELHNKKFGTISSEAETKMREVIEQCRINCDSIGGEIECAVTGLPIGLGGNIFDTIEGNLAKILFGIPAVKGVQFGLGFDFAKSNASNVNDEYEVKDGKVALISNNNGGVLGGMTTGAPIIVSVAIKPTPSIGKEQRSVNLKTMKNETLVINGRHDPCIVPRAVPVIETAVAFEILDILCLEGKI